MRSRAIIMLASVPVAHLAYELPWFEDGSWGKQWAQWCFEHIAGMMMALLLFDVFRGVQGWARTVGVAACAWMVYEDLQCTLCGYLSWQQPNIPGVARLCVDRFGTEPYIVAAAAALAYLGVQGIKKWTGEA